MYSPVLDRPRSLPLSPRRKSPHFADIVCSPFKASSLSLRSCRSVTPANVGRRRNYSASLLASPARGGHASRMAHIFQEAASSLHGTRSGTPVISESDGPEIVQYPSLPRLASDFPSPLTNRHVGRSPLRPNFTQTRNFTSPRRFQKSEQPPQSAETVRPLNSLADLGRPRPVNFEEIALASDPCCNNDNDIAYASSSASSASWTGDSDFFYKTPPPRRPKPTDGDGNGDQATSVSKWLESVHDESSTPDSEERLTPLSPSVELRRGSMRRRWRECERRGRRRPSFDDADSFVSGGKA